jgi:hypothetical protein
MENQTAVDYAISKLEKFIEPGNQLVIRVIRDNAKDMEKEQHSNTWNHGSYSLLDHGSGEDFEQYYFETYGKTN